MVNLRHVNGVPVWNGDILTLRDSETAGLWFKAGSKPGEQEGAVARLWANLQGPAKEVVRMCKPSDFEHARRVERLLRILQDSPSASMPVPDAYKKIQAYGQIRRQQGEVIGDYIEREQRAFRECVQQAEALAAEGNRTLAHARSAVASAKQNRSGFLPPSNVPSSRKGKVKLERKSKDSSCIICGRGVHFWRQCPELFQTVLLQVDVVQLVLIDAVTQGFPDSRVEVHTLERP